MPSLYGPSLLYDEFVMGLNKGKVGRACTCIFFFFFLRHLPTVDCIHVEWSMFGK